MSKNQALSARPCGAPESRGNSVVRGFLCARDSRRTPTDTPTGDNTGTDYLAFSASGRKAAAASISRAIGSAEDGKGGRILRVVTPSPHSCSSGSMTILSLPSSGSALYVRGWLG